MQCLSYLVQLAITVVEQHDTGFPLAGLGPCPRADGDDVAVGQQ